MALLLLAPERRAAVWRTVFAAANEPLILGEAAVSNPAAVTHLACWDVPQDLARYPNLHTVISTGAGVDQFHALPPHLSIVRSTAGGVTDMVRDWVVMAVLMLHRDMPVYLDQATAGRWHPRLMTPAARRRVGIMGMGRIGQAAAQALSALGFDVAGLNRSGQDAAGIPCFAHSDRDAFLARCDTLVCLLPLTDATRGLMDAGFLAGLPKGAQLVQAGRGAQLDLAALRGALEAGRISAAMLDVTDPEPLPQDHWLWSDPRVIVTPHVAAVTDDAEGAHHALGVIRAGRAGHPPEGLVDRSRGY